MLSATSSPGLAASTETGNLNVMHLKRYWNKAILKRERKTDSDAYPDEWNTDAALLAVIGTGLEQTLKYLYQTKPTFEEFENWILATAGIPDQDKVTKFNLVFSADYPSVEDSAIEQILSSEELSFWNENGYIVVPDAISQKACTKTVRLICEHIGVDGDDHATWYRPHHDRQGIMVQLFQHPQLEENRRSAKIRKVFEQLWNRKDLYVNTDRVGFNPPVTASFPFQGPYLHWDVSLQLPIPFGLQGLLYLADTSENQGAFTLVPGFQNKINDWLPNLPANADPRKQDLYALGAIPIAAKAGDLIVWHQALPHGSSPNTNTKPRFVQYLNYMPVDTKHAQEWK